MPDPDPSARLRVSLTPHRARALSTASPQACATFTQGQFAHLLPAWGPRRTQTCTRWSARVGAAALPSPGPPRPHGRHTWPVALTCDLTGGGSCPAAPATPVWASCLASGLLEATAHPFPPSGLKLAVRVLPRCARVSQRAAWPGPASPPLHTGLPSLCIQGQPPGAATWSSACHLGRGCWEQERGSRPAAPALPPRRLAEQQQARGWHPHLCCTHLGGPVGMRPGQHMGCCPGQFGRLGAPSSPAGLACGRGAVQHGSAEVCGSHVSPSPRGWTDPWEGLGS